MRLKAILGGLLLASCTPEPGGDAPVIDQIEQGTIEACTDPRWAEWRFGGREAEVEALHAEVKARRDAAAKENAGWASTPVISRLVMADLILDAVMAEPDKATFDAAQTDAEKAASDAATAAAAIKGDDFNALQLRFAVMNGQQTVVRAFMEAGDSLRGNLYTCHMRPAFREAVTAMSSRLLEIAAQRGWPNDATDGKGAAFQALSVNKGMTLKPDGEAACAKLTGSGGVERGAAALLRLKLQCDPEPPATAEAWIERFEGDWPKVKSLLDAIPKPGLREEFAVRVEFEQYGRFTGIEFNQRFPDAAKDQTTYRRVWAPVEAADHDNTARLKELLATRDWFDDAVDGPEVQSRAWHMVQHADDDPDFQRMVLGRLEKYLGTPRIAGPDYALLWDRVALKDQRPQRYASQVTCKDGKFIALGEVEEPAKLDERRTKMGLQPFDEYLKVITDSYGACQG